MSGTPYFVFEKRSARSADECFGQSCSRERCLWYRCAYVRVVLLWAKQPEQTLLIWCDWLWWSVGFHWCRRGTVTFIIASTMTSSRLRRSFTLSWRPMAWISWKCSLRSKRQTSCTSEWLTLSAWVCRYQRILSMSLAITLNHEVRQNWTGKRSLRILSSGTVTTSKSPGYMAVFLASDVVD